MRASIFVLMLGVLSSAALAEEAQVVSLREAMQTASAAHPRLISAQKEVEAALGRAKEEGAYAYNPELSLEAQRRRLIAGGRSLDQYFALSQRIELGGKRRWRQKAARLAVRIADARLNFVRQQVQIEAAKAYLALWAACKRLAVRKRQQKLWQRLLAGMRRKAALGEASQMELLLLQAAYAAAVDATMKARQALADAEAQYQLAMGNEAPPPQRLRLPPVRRRWPLGPEAEQIALASRADLAALRLQLAQAKAQRRLARAQRIPDPAISLMLGKEAGDRLALVGLSLPLPLWNTHRGTWEEAIAQEERLQQSWRWARKQLAIELARAQEAMQQALQALDEIETASALASAERSMQQAQLAFEAGEIGLDALVVRLQRALNAQLAAIAVQQAAWSAQIRFAELLGRPEMLWRKTP